MARSPPAVHPPTALQIVELRASDYDAVLNGLLDLARELVAKVPLLKSQLGAKGRDRDAGQPSPNLHALFLWRR